MNNPFTLAKLCWMGAAFVVTFFAVGLPYWSVPYDKIALPNTLGLSLLVVGLISAGIRICGGVGFLLATIAVGASVPAAIMARVIVDTNNDPTSHNLWPFEVVLASVTGFVCSGVGALVGSACVWLAKKF